MDITRIVRVGASEPELRIVKQGLAFHDLLDSEGDPNQGHDHNEAQLPGGEEQRPVNQTDSKLGFDLDEIGHRLCESREIALVHLLRLLRGLVRSDEENVREGIDAEESEALLILFELDIVEEEVGGVGARVRVVGDEGLGEEREFFKLIETAKEEEEEVEAEEIEVMLGEVLLEKELVEEEGEVLLGMSKGSSAPASASASSGGRVVRAPGDNKGVEVGHPAPSIPSQPQPQTPPPAPVADYVVEKLKFKEISEDSDKIIPVKRHDKGGKLAIRTDELRANHFPVNFNRNTIIMHYVVDVQLAVPPKNVRPMRISKSVLSEGPDCQNPPRQVRIVDYFREKYDKDIPCLDLRKANKENAVPERLDRNAGTILKNLSLVPPSERERDMQRGTLRKWTFGGMAQNFGMEVNTSMTRVRGRVLGPPVLKLGAQNGKVIEVTVDEEKYQWNLVKKSVVEGKRIDRWGVIDFSSNDYKSSLNPDFFIPKLINRCINLGIQMEEPLVYKCTSMNKLSRVDVLLELVESVNEEAYKKDKGHLQILLCVMSRRDPGYKYLKWISETKVGIVTQCCLSTCRANDQYFANLATKMNAKLGGSNVELITRSPILEAKAM
ncbi:hypothetical protein SO802_031238 [Lithocarpus litseifolius]|uniref:Piwi domain-containing protein n=1 Tax=Lithocarpus litseifolius TaxID=425828 RepID=A0AAW2BMA2_9ROSI